MTSHYTNSVYSARFAPTNPPENPSVYSGPAGKQPSIFTARTVTSYQSSYYTDQHASLMQEKEPITSKIGRFIWNPEKSEFCGRTWDSWLKILAFYAGFYAVLIAVWAVCWAMFDWRVLMEDYPVRTGESNILRLSPSLSMIPQPDYYTSLIRFKRSQKGSYRKYVDDIVAVTQFYEDHGFQNIGLGQSNENTQDCARTGPIEPFDERKVCKVNLDIGGRCNVYRQFGYSEGAPCIILKMNRIYGWIPDLPINNATGLPNSGIQVKCYGLHDADKDAIGNVCYHDDNDINTPNQCSLKYGELKHYYYPYLKQNRYMSPLVFVEFMNPQPNVIIMVECIAMANNIPINKQYREGIVRFEFLMD